MRSIRIFAAAFFVLCMAFVFASCGNGKNTCTVTFDAQGGSAVPTQTVERGSRVQKPADPEKAGYTFDGWTYLGENWSFVGYVVTEDMTLTASWTPIEYAVSYNLNGGTNNASNPATYTIEDAVTLAAPTRKGYNFAGWTDNGKIAKGSTGKKTFVAEWEIITYAVSYDLCGGTNDGTNPATYTVEDAVTLAAPTREYYTFTGWSDGGKIAKGSTGDKTFTANWTLTKYGITYNLSGGTNAGTNPATYTVEDAVTLAAPTREYYTFTGWSDGGKIAKGSTGTKTFTANWTSSGLNYKSNGDGTCSVSGFGSFTGPDLIIPPVSSTGDRVTSIGDGAFSACSWLTSVTIPDGVKSIGSTAFSYCYGLKSVTIPDSVTSIGRIAFEGCSGLTAVTIPDSVTSIGERAFKGCRGLTGSLTIPDGVTSIGNEAFYNCSRLTSITIPDSVKSIEYSAFRGCSGLTSVTIPDGVTSIGSYAFFGCSGLTTVTVGNGVTSIGEDAFCLCEGLTTVTIPDGVTSIGNSAFSGCTGLTSITIPDSVTSIGSDAFSHCSGLKSITIPDGVTSIGDYAFDGCSGLTSVTIPDGVTSIGNSAFSYCSGLTAVTIPDSVTRIGEYAFYRCSGLTSITFPDSVKSIGYRAFEGCKGLTAVTIPDGVTSIGAWAFEDCTGLTSVTFQNSSGWYVTTMQNASSGTNVTVTDASTNATELKDTYSSYYWYRK